MCSNIYGTLISLDHNSRLPPSCNASSFVAISTRHHYILNTRWIAFSVGSISSVVVGLLVHLSELDGAVQRLGVGAGDGVGLVVAGEGLLVEDGGVAAGERPLRVVHDRAHVVLDRKADVEDLAVVGDVRVVAVVAALAAERLGNWLGQSVVGAIGELVAAGALKIEVMESISVSISNNKKVLATYRSVLQL